MKHYFLTRNREFVECEVLENSNRKRVVKITEDGHELKGKKKTITPEGVASGKLYPRLFHLDKKPTKDDYVEVQGRIMVKKSNDKAMVPDLTTYQFMPVTSHVIDSIYAGDNVLLTGEAGTGKTSMIEQLAARINQPVLRVNLNGETRIGDFLGRMNVIATAGKGSETKWVDGILPLAMKKGMWLILDEIDMGEPNILSLLHPILEPGGRLVLKENEGEEVRPHPNFRIFGTANGIGSQVNRGDTYAGVNQMNEAFIDRWHIITMPNLPPKVEVKVIRERYPHLAPKFAKRIVQFGQAIRKGLENEALTMGFSTRRALQWASKIALYRNAQKAAEAVFLCKVTPEDRAVLERQISLHFGGKRRTKIDKSVVTDSVPQTPIVGQKRGRGRPKGSKNKVQP